MKEKERERASEALSAASEAFAAASETLPASSQVLYCCSKHHPLQNCNHVANDLTKYQISKELNGNVDRLLLLSY